MQKKDPGEEIAADYLKQLGLTVEKLDQGATKVPDFQVTSSNGYCFFAEIKSIRLQGQEAAVLWKSLHNSFGQKIFDATLQFNAVNSQRLVPNVLIFVSDDMRINEHSMHDFFNGKVDMFDEDTVVDVTRQRDGRVKQINQIDLFVFISHTGDPSFVYNNIEQRFVDSLARIFQR